MGFKRLENQCKLCMLYYVKKSAYMCATHLCVRTTERKQKDVIVICCFTIDFLSLLHLFLSVKCWNIAKDLCWNIAKDLKNYKKIWPLVQDIKDISLISSMKRKIKKNQPVAIHLQK